MADFVTNRLTITCKDSKLQEKIKKLIFNYDENNVPTFTMEILLPLPAGFSKNPTYTEYGHDWCVAVWGTKWDAYYPMISESGATIIITYETAWDPNIEWVKALCRYIKIASFSLDRSIEKGISVIHFYCDDYEDYGPEMKWSPLNGCDIKKNVNIFNQYSG